MKNVPVNAHKTERSVAESQTTGFRVVVILANCGLKIGRDGLVDAYDRGVSTGPVVNDSVRDFRPDVVHQCLLALYDSDLAVSGGLQVFMCTTQGKTIELAPELRPPRTYSRFKGLMENLLRDGEILSSDGRRLLHVMKGSVWPMIPHGAKVLGLSNAPHATLQSATETATECIQRPVGAELQGGLRGITGFFCVACNDSGSLEGVDFITEERSLSPLPMTPHVMCLRLMEGFQFAHRRGARLSVSDGAKIAAAQAARPEQTKPRVKRPRAE